MEALHPAGAVLLSRSRPLVFLESSPGRSYLVPPENAVLLREGLGIGGVRPRFHSLTPEFHFMRCRFPNKPRHWADRTIFRMPEMRLPLNSFVIGALSLFLISSSVVLADEESVRKVSYQRDVQPIFAKHCLGCHQDAKPLGQYVMTRFDALTTGGETGERAIVPGDPDASYLIAQITPVDGKAEMPRQAPPLSQAEIDIVRRWVAEGAEDDSPADSGPRFTSENPPVYSRLPSVTSIDAAPAGNLLAVAGFYEVLLINAEDGQIAGRLVGMSERIESVRFSPDGNRLAVVGGQPGRSGEVQIWNVAEQSLELSTGFTFETLRGVSWSPDGSMVAFGGADNVVRAIDAQTGELKVRQGAHEDWVLGTAFTAKGDHIVSVAQDMTCKLTETATQRFIDNITSITPGALRGGLSSVVSLPGRDEIFVGGADGVAKVYRVFRATARQIGDDANLVRTLPTLPGRIFAVDVSADAKQLCALASLDTHSELRVWKTREVLDMPEDIKAIHAKQAGQRNAEEAKKLAAFVTPENEQLIQVRFDVPAYAACFLPSGEVAVAGADGQVRIINGAGEIVRQFAAAPQPSPEDASPSAIYEPLAWYQQAKEAEAAAVQARAETGATGLLLDQVEAIDVYPSQEALLNSKFDYIQVLVQARLKNGEIVDATRDAQYQVSENLVITPSGLLRPLTAGKGNVTIAVGSHQANLPVLVGDNVVADQTTSVDFIRDVNPVMTRLGCNQGTCHGAQKGKNGFKLSLRGYDPIFDIRALTDDLAARRINLASPGDSLFLQKALGRVPHEGGALVAAGSPNHGILHRWVADGAKLEMSSERAVRIEIQPENPVVQQLGSTQQVRVVAFYADGSSRDVTREAFLESGNTEVATSSATGVLTALRRGEAAILARYEGNYVASTLTVMGQRDGFEWQPVEAYGQIDALVAEKWQRMKINPSEVCDDATFLRRIYLDLTGLPPTAEQVRNFLADTRPVREKRSEIVDALLSSPEYVEYWTNKWADLLQVNRKFLGAEGAAQFREWIRAAIAENRPYDQFAREILTSEGSNKKNPAASYYKILRTPEDMMENTTHLFLGVRFNCNKCHDHPFERWTQDQYYETAAFFAKTKLRKDPEGGDAVIGGSAVEGAKPLYEEVFDDQNGQIQHPRTNTAVVPDFPYESEFEVAENADDRDRLANWITSADNQYFARSYVNRIWGYMLGVGLIEPIDDIRAGNPPTNPELLDYLTEQFVTSDFDVRHIMRLICNSRTYQLSVATNEWNADDRSNYSHALPRRLPAEVLYDAIHFVTGAKTKIPGVPEGTRAAALPDVGVATPDGFLANLGRPVRESACECERSSELQLGPIMALVSGPTVGSAISDQGNDLNSLVARINEDDALVDELFVRILNRTPTSAEVEAFRISMQQIDDDHAALEQALQQREQEWVERLPQIEAQQKADVESTQKAIADLEESLRPERERMEAERNAKIAAAEAAIKAAKENIAAKVPEWEQHWAQSPEWFLLQPKALSATAGNVLAAQSDRSIRASGSKEKSTYEVTVETKLPTITGFRLETLPIPDQPGGGPGFPENGNFVVTEFEVLAAPLEGGEAKPVKIASGKASFTQAGFAIEQAFDGNTNNQQGWAIHPYGGLNQWATFTLAEPISMPQGTKLIFKIHQYHDAVAHRLAAFRLSATNGAGPLPLSLPEAFAAALASPADARSEAALKPLLDFLAKTDDSVRQAETQLGVAQTPIPENPDVTALKRQLAELQKPIQTDPVLVRLRADFEQSKAQVANKRLTAAEDLTWALINSPAFLFNR